MAGPVKIAILGSTGSIGVQTLEVIRSFPQRFKVVGLAAGKNVPLLLRQAEEFAPQIIWAEEGLTSTGPGCRIVPPEEMAGHPDVEVVVVATAGAAGLGPTLAAIRAGKKIALANKEVLVMAGDIVMAEAGRWGAQILPIDSEHSALWQCLRGEERKAVSRLILTASGGPFRNMSPEELRRVTPEQALDHPTWRMGKKVTVDSATLMNKGMEVIEAHHLFGVPYENIEVVVHPQSIVHSLVEFADGSVKAQLSFPDMRLPIQYALAYPERLNNPALPRLDLISLRALTFEPPDPERFPCLRLAVEAGRRGKTYPAVLCAADEVAVALFLSRRIGFMDIPELVSRALERHVPVASPSLEEILEADRRTREEVLRLASALSGSV